LLHANRRIRRASPDIKNLLRNHQGPVSILVSTRKRVEHTNPDQHKETPMFTRRFTTLAARTSLTTAALGLVALGLAGTADASSVDDTFLAQLQADGIQPPTAARAISDAHAICKALDAGHSPQEVIGAVAQATGLSTKGAKTFSVDAASAYCPQYVTST
jgi:hypothetical protein